MITKGSIGQALTVLNLALDSNEGNISPSSPHEVSIHVENAIHFWVWKFRKVSSYTLLNGSRLPWPLSYCFESQALFRSTIPRDGAYYAAWRLIPYRQICLPKEAHWERSLVSLSIVVFSNFPCPYPKVIVRWRIDYQDEVMKADVLSRLWCFDNWSRRGLRTWSTLWDKMAYHHASIILQLSSRSLSEVEQSNTFRRLRQKDRKSRHRWNFTQNTLFATMLSAFPLPGSSVWLCFVEWDTNCRLHSNW